jgi:carotenoid cleavage dioxygenase-like enzyme
LKAGYLALQWTFPAVKHCKAATCSSKAFTIMAGCFLAEPLFVPRPGAEEEDDGVVATVVTGADGSSFMLLQDGQTFEEVARIALHVGVPYQFHGNFWATS